MLESASLVKMKVHRIFKFSPKDSNKEFIRIAASFPMSERKVQSKSEGSEIDRTLAAVKAAKRMRAKLRKNINLNRNERSEWNERGSSNKNCNLTKNGESTVAEISDIIDETTKNLVKRKGENVATKSDSTVRLISKIQNIQLATAPKTSIIRLIAAHQNMLNPNTSRLEELKNDKDTKEDFVKQNCSTSHSVPSVTKNIKSVEHNLKSGIEDRSRYQKVVACIPLQYPDICDRGESWKVWSCIRLAYLLKDAMLSISMDDVQQYVVSPYFANPRHGNQLKKRGRYLTRRKEKFWWKTAKGVTLIGRLFQKKYGGIEDLEEIYRQI